MADLVKAASAALCVAGSTCVDVIGRPLPADGQARQRIYQDLFDRKVEQLLGEPLRPLEVFGKMTLDQLNRRIQVLEVLRFEAELEGKRLKDVPEAERTKEMSAYAEGKLHKFVFDLYELASADERMAANLKDTFEREKRLLMDPTTAITVTAAASSTSAAPAGTIDQIVAKAKEMLSTNTGKAVAGIGAVALIWVLTQGE